MKETKNHSFDDEPLNAWFKGSSDHIPPESNHSIRKANDLTTNARAVCTKVKCLPELADKTANLGISAVKIILAVFIITFMLQLSFWIFSEEDHTTIYPFKTTGMDESLDGRSLAELLNWGLYDINETNYQASQIAVPAGSLDKFDKVVIEGKGSVSFDSTPLLNELSSFKDSSLENSLSQIGTVGIGDASLSLGNMILSMRSLCHKDPCIIEGSLNKYGSTLIIIATTGGGGPIEEGVWLVRKNLSGDNLSVEEHIPSMIEDLSYKIALDLGKQSQLQSDLPQTWQALKYTIAGKRAYITFNTTRNDSDLHKAREMALLALQSDPSCNKSIDLLTKLAFFCLNENKVDVAEALFKDVLRFRPSSSEAGYGLGLIYTKKGSYAEAIEAFNEAVGSDPNLAQAWYNKGIALWANGMYDKAFQAFNNATKLNDSYAEAWCYKGWILIRQGKYNDAIACLDKAINIKPNYADAWNEKGNALLYQGKYEKALESKDKALELDPSLSYIWFDKGLVLYSMERYNKALEAFDRAQTLQPSDPEIEMWKKRTAAHLAKQSVLNKTTVNNNFDNNTISEGLKPENITEEDKQKVMNFLDETGGVFTPEDIHSRLGMSEEQFAEVVETQYFE